MRALTALVMALAVVSPWASRPAGAEVQDASPSGFTLENRVEVAVDAATAWKALVEDVDAWWPKDHTWWGAESRLSIEPRAGGCFCERKGDAEAQHLMVTFVDPPKLLRLSGGLGPLQGMGLQGVLEFRLAPTPGGTAITLFYRVGGYTPDDLSRFAPVVDSVQALQLGGLAVHLGAPAGGPDAPGGGRK
jgi:uncharacterized protein YndB with AHSA1/START domain